MARGPLFSKEEKLYLIEQKREDKTFVDIASGWRKKFGLHRTASVLANLWSALKSLNFNIEEEAEISDEGKAVQRDMQIEKLKYDLKSIKKLYEEAKNKLRESEERNRVLNTIHSSPKSKALKIPKITSKHEATAVVVASDWHLEERVDPSTVNDKNEFDPQIAERRIKTFFQKCVHITDLFRAGMQINRLVLALLGDMITGYIHEELVEDNYLSPIQATLLAKNLITGGIEYLLNEGNFEEIIIVCKFGNHGRTTLKRRISSSFKNSYEWGMYQDLANTYKDHEKVKIVAENGYHTFLPVYDNFVIRFHHGDAMRFMGGVGGITIPANKAIAQWNKSERVDLDVFGHFHQFFYSGPFLCNGSLIGYNAYSVSIKAEYQPPIQGYFLVNRRRATVPVIAKIFVDDKEEK